MGWSRWLRDLTHWSWKQCLVLPVECSCGPLVASVEQGWGLLMVPRGLQVVVQHRAQGRVMQLGAPTEWPHSWTSLVQWAWSGTPLQEGQVCEVVGLQLLDGGSAPTRQAGKPVACVSSRV